MEKSLWRVGEEQGLVAESHAGDITFSSPLKSIKEIRSIVLGDMIMQKDLTD